MQPNRIDLGGAGLALCCHLRPRLASQSPLGHVPTDTGSWV